ncbi:hypothetical protein KR200_002379 [Drosophila serrata]|nr:hypothetical protein KR200_002379 [Drosophila serrata]
MGEEGAPTTAAPAKTTASGATMMAVSPWLTAAVVAAYATKAMWVKLRRVGSSTLQKKQKVLMNDPPLELQENENESKDHEAEAESGDEFEGAPAVVQDEMLKHFESDAGPTSRMIEL